MQRNKKGQFSSNDKKTEMMRVTKEEKQLIELVRNNEFNTCRRTLGRDQTANDCLDEPKISIKNMCLYCKKQYYAGKEWFEN